MMKNIGDSVNHIIWECGQLFRFKEPSHADVDVSSLPDIVSTLTGKKQHPANCWNATMAYFGATDIKYSPPEEMEKWLKENTYIDAYKRCTKNTIMVFRHQGDLIHTAVFVAPNKLWHKRGVHGKWEFISLRDICGVYFGCTHEYRLLKE